MMVPIVASLLMALPTPLAAPGLAEPTPTDVRLAWESPAEYRFAVTWQETGSLRNKVMIVESDGSPGSWDAKIVEADQPDLTTFQHIGAPGRDFRVTVRAVDADGEPVSDAASSALFDTDPPPRPVIESVVPAADGTVAMRWRQGTVDDRTPNDPLDLPAEPMFVPIASTPYWRGFDWLWPLSPATSTVFRDRPLPAWLGVETSGNEWSFKSSVVATVTDTRLTAVVPTTATTGAPLLVTGKAYRVERFCDMGPCFTEDSPGRNRTVELQSRTGPTAPWRVVSATTSTKDGDFRLSVVSPGSRQYRVVAPPVPLGAEPEAKAYFATAPTFTTSRPAPPTPAPTSPTPAPSGDGDGTDGGDTGADTGGGGSTGAGGGLAITGAPAATVAGPGGLLVAVGVLLRWAARRRRAS